MAIAMDQEVEAPVPAQVPYQNLLRSIGAHLDEQAASQITILETDTSFLVRYQSPDVPLEVVSVRFGPENLDAWDRRRQRQRAGESTAAQRRAQGRYQDVLRAFGYELEHASARQISLEELDGTYVLTYYALGTGDGARVRKHRMVIPPVETEQILRRARSRRRSPAAGSLLGGASVASDPARLVRVTDPERGFVPIPGVVLEYTVTALSAAARAAIEQHDSARARAVYRPSHASAEPRASTEERLVRPFEAASLIAAVYARCLDPIRFAGATLGKEQVIGAFARSLTAPRVRGAVEFVAGHIDDLRSLDRYQPSLGTNTVHWMQHLAAEALSIEPSPAARENASLLCALTTIRDSQTVADRFAAIRRMTAAGE